MEGNPSRARNKKGRFKKETSSFFSICVNTGIDENNNETQISSFPTDTCVNNSTAVDVNNSETQTSEHDDDVSSTDLSETEESEELSRVYTNIFDGRRIIEFAVLVEHLKRGCFVCHTPLDLANCVKERQYGLASLLYIECTNCKELTIVPTGKRHNIGPNGQGPFDVNTKLGVALTHAGVGEAVVTKLFSTLNIHCLSHSNLKKRERECAPVFESLAKMTCNDALENEAHRSGDSGLILSYDAGWQKRGSGRNYNSLSGHGSMTGCKTGKVVGYDVMAKSCRVCKSAELRGREKKEHDCRKNWEGSSKSMEPSMAVKILKGIENKGHKVKTLIMDDGTSTIHKVRLEVNADMQKCSDKNHTFKNFANNLYALQKEKYKRILSVKTISHIKKCFAYAVSSNREEPISLKENLLAIPNHLYGKHSSCQVKWCRYLQNKETYTPKHLPYGKYLTDTNLFEDLQQLFTSYANQSERLSLLESTQHNENFNHIVSRKNPKNNFYSGSESTNVRVAAAVCEKNIGAPYVLQIHEELSLSPGTCTAKDAERKMKKRKKNFEQISSKEFKKRRVELKKKSSSAISSSETREGITYESGVLSQSSSIPDERMETIPSPPEQLHQVPLPPGEYSRVYFDLETTGLDASCEITQMAARCADFSFCQYVLPSVAIQETASRITGLTCDGSTLYKNGVPVQACSIQECLTSFREWLNNTPGIRKPVLFAHNCRKFDSVVLCRAMRKCSNIPLQDCIIGFCDTLPMLKEHTSCNPSNSTLETLVLEILGCTFDAHDALEDCAYLQKLVEYHNTESYYLNYSFSMDYIMQVVNQMEVSKSNLQTLMPLIRNKVVSESMVKKMSLSGLSLHHIQLAYNRGGFDGVHSVLSENFNGKPRVTKRKNIITSVVQFLKET